MDTKKDKTKQTDYQLALEAYKSVDFNDATTLENMCKEVGIDYESL